MNFLIWFLGMIILVLVNQFIIWYLVHIIDKLEKKLEKKEDTNIYIDYGGGKII